MFDTVRTESGIRTEVKVAVVPDTTKAEEEKLTEQVVSIEGYAGNLVIQDDADYEKAGQFGRELKKKVSEVTNFFKPMKDSAYKAHKEVCDREKAMIAPLRNAEKALKKAMGVYSMKKEEERKAQEKALREAAQREADRKLQEAIDLEKAGKAEEAAEALTEAEVMDTATQYVVPTVAEQKVTGVSTSRDWEIVSIDDSKVPVTLAGTMIRPVDTAAVMRLIRASKGEIQIPGVKFQETKKISFRR